MLDVVLVICWMLVVVLYVHPPARIEEYWVDTHGPPIGARADYISIKTKSTLNMWKRIMILF